MWRLCTRVGVFTYRSFRNQGCSCVTVLYLGYRLKITLVWEYPGQPWCSWWYLFRCSYVSKLLGSRNTLLNWWVFPWKIQANPQYQGCIWQDVMWPVMWHLFVVCCFGCYFHRGLLIICQCWSNCWILVDQPKAHVIQASLKDTVRFTQYTLICAFEDLEVENLPVNPRGTLINS